MTMMLNNHACRNARAHIMCIFYVWNFAQFGSCAKRKKTDERIRWTSGMCVFWWDAATIKTPLFYKVRVLEAPFFHQMQLGLSNPFNCFFWSDFFFKGVEVSFERFSMVIFVQLQNEICAFILSENVFLKGFLRWYVDFFCDMRWRTHNIILGGHTHSTDSWKWPLVGEEL